MCLLRLRMHQTLRRGKVIKRTLALRNYLHGPADEAPLRIYRTQDASRSRNSLLTLRLLDVLSIQQPAIAQVIVLGYQIHGRGSVRTKGNPHSVRKAVS
jgi:hypothetical protein